MVTEHSTTKIIDGATITVHIMATLTVSTPENTNSTQDNKSRTW